MGPAITGECPVEEPPRIVRLGHVDNRQDAADASKLLANVVCVSVLGPATHMAKAVGYRDAGRQLRMGTVPIQVIDSEIGPVALRQPKQPALFVHLVVFVRAERRRSVSEVCSRSWSLWIGNIDYHDTGVRLPRVVFRCDIGAVIEV